LELNYQIRRAFYGVLQLETFHQSAKRAIDRLERHRNQVETAIANGMSGEEARLLVLSRLQQAKTRLTQVETEIQSASLQLGLLTGTSGEPVEPSGDIAIPLIPLEWDTKVTSQLPELHALEQRHSSAGEGIRTVKSALKPSINAQAIYHYGKPGVNQIENEWMGYATIGIQASWTVWDWSARKAKVQQATQNQNRLSLRKQEAADRLNHRLQNAKMHVEAVLQELIPVAKKVDIEKRRLELVSARYQQAQATQSELLDMEDDLANAEIEFNQVVAKQRLAEVELLRASGR